MTEGFPRQNFLGVEFDVAREAEVLAAVRRAADSDHFRFLVTPNVDHVVRLDRNNPADAAALKAYRQAWLTVCDSRIIGGLAKLSGVDLPVVPGSDLTARLLQDERFAGLHCLMVGGTPATIATLRGKFPGLRWSHHRPGPDVLRDHTAQTGIVQAVCEARADIVFMAFGFPQSELVCQIIAASGQGRGVALCIGASLEFLTGEKTRAPRLMQQLRLEWLFRLVSEPRRLWRRYLVVGPRIFLIWARASRRRNPA